MAEQDRLRLVGHAIASIVDGESAAFTRELARVLASLERSLLGVLTAPPTRGLIAPIARLLTLRKEVRQALTVAGYRRLVTRASIDVVSRLASRASTRGLAGQAATLGQVSPARLSALAKTLQLDLLGLGDDFARQVWRAAVLATYTRDPRGAIVDALAKAIERTRAQATTLFDTQVSIIGRQIEAEQTPSGPEQAYMYVGPVDRVVRPFCEDLVGKVFTRDRIEQMDNGQLPNVFLTGGGYRCRHTFLAVSDPSLIAIVNTGERAAGYDDRLRAVA